MQTMQARFPHEYKERSGIGTLEMFAGGENAKIAEEKYEPIFRQRYIVCDSRLLLRIYCVLTTAFRMP